MIYCGLYMCDVHCVVAILTLHAVGFKWLLTQLVLTVWFMRWLKSIQLLFRVHEINVLSDKNYEIQSVKLNWPQPSSCDRVCNSNLISGFCLVSLTFFFRPTGYHWDTSDWMPSIQLPGIQEFPQYEVVESPPTLYTDPALLDTDYYPGGYDIESDFPPPPDDFPAHDDLPPPPPVPEYGDRYDTLRSTTRAPNSTPSSPGGSGVRQRPPLPQLYSLTQFLPQHHYSSDAEPQTNPSSTITSSTTGGYRRGGYPLSYGSDFNPPAADNMSLSLYTSTASCSDMSACCEESEVMMSDFESDGEEEEGTPLQRLVIPPLDSHHPQQHTEVWHWIQRSKISKVPKRNPATRDCALLP